MNNVVAWVANDRATSRWGRAVLQNTDLRWATVKTPECQNSNYVALLCPSEAIIIISVTLYSTSRHEVSEASGRPLRTTGPLSWTQQLWPPHPAPEGVGGFKEGDLEHTDKSSLPWAEAVRRAQPTGPAFAALHVCVHAATCSADHQTEMAEEMSSSTCWGAPASTAANSPSMEAG